MMGFDLRKIGDAVVDYAPGIAAALTTVTGGAAAPAGIALTALSALGKACGLGSDATPEEIHAAIQTADPETKLKLMQAENDFKLKIREQDLDELKARLNDVQSARQAEVAKTQATGKRDINLYVLAYLYIAGFFISMIAMVWMMIDGTFPEEIPQALVFLLGNLFGCLTSGVGAIIQYFFGTSASSAKKTDLLTQINTQKR